MFVVLKKKRILVFCAAVLAVMTLLLAVSGPEGAAAVFAGKAGIRKLPIYCVDTEEKKVALTFDAAWGADKTEKVLEILKENDASGTFFLVGFWIDKYPEMLLKMDEQGIEIGTHSETHAHMSKLSYEKQREELMSSSKKITDITGKPVKIFRPPFGEYNDNLINACGSLNLKCIQWDVDSLDWKDKSAAEIVSRVTSRAKCGSIILFHNNSLNIETALPVLIAALKNKGYSFSTVSDLVYEDGYTIDHTGTQKKQVTL